MALYRINVEALKPLHRTSLAEQGYNEGADLQELLRKRPEVIEPGLLVISLVCSSSLRSSPKGLANPWQTLYTC